MKSILATTLALLLSACAETTDVVLDETLNDKTALAVINETPAEVVEALTEMAAPSGALSRNNPTYFHVRFQVGIGFNAAYAASAENEAALMATAKSIQYSFTHQRPAGDFDIAVPPSLQHLGDPDPADLASGIAFFGSAMGMGLMVLKQSPWYTSLPASHPAKALIESQRTKMQLMLNFLKQQEQTLVAIDERAANRLFWDARCFYAMGLFLNDAQAIEAAERFLQLALTRQDSSGFFIENDGFDSSYNGVSLLIGLQAYTLLPPGILKADLGKALVRCAQWQINRIMSSGEISLAGNTRVYPGGEQFLGEEKSVAWIDCVLAMYWLRSLTDNDQYLIYVTQLRDFYE